MAPRDSTQPKTPQERLEDIVSHKRHVLLEDPHTPPRIRNFLDQVKNNRSIAEIMGYLVFPKESQEKSGRFLMSALLSPAALKDQEFFRLKSEVQRVEHLTEHTRLSVLNVLDDLRNK